MKLVIAILVALVVLANTSLAQSNGEMPPLARQEYWIMVSQAVDWKVGERVVTAYPWRIYQSIGTRGDYYVFMFEGKELYLPQKLTVVPRTGMAIPKGHLGNEEFDEMLDEERKQTSELDAIRRHINAPDPFPVR